MTLHETLYNFISFMTNYGGVFHIVLAIVELHTPGNYL